MKKFLNRLTYLWKHRGHRWRAIWRWVDVKALRARLRHYHAVARWSLHRFHSQKDLAEKARKAGRDRLARQHEKRAETFAEAYHYAHHKYHKLLARYERKHAPAPSTDTGLTTIDGRSGPTWIAKIILAYRDAGGQGTVTSFGRTREYSEHLCYLRCRQPACPGTCAGVNSNHACPPAPYFGDPGALQGGCPPYQGAIDFTGYYTLSAYCRAHNLPLYGLRLPYDLVHFSHTGN